MANAVMQIGSGGTGSGNNLAWPWCIFRNNITIGESVAVPADSFLLGIDTFTIDGTLDLEGTLVIL